MEFLMKNKLERSFLNQSLERALQILCAFTFDTQKLTLTELSNKLEIPKTTTYRLASTLMDCGFLNHDETTKHYSLGLKLMELGSIVYDSFSLRHIASPALNELLAKMGNKAVFLAIFRNDEVIYIDKKEDPRNPIKFATTEVGRHRPPYFGMFGKVFLAFMAEGESDRILRQHSLTAISKRSITDIGLYKAQLCEVREEGYAFDNEGAFDGISGIASPIWDAGDNVVAAVGVGFISSSEDDVSRAYIIESVKEAASIVSEQLSSIMLPVAGRRRA
jgi:DNA-binding IclR family transcriptional regulator